METHYFDLAASNATGTRALAHVGMVASGNLEVLLERRAPSGRCRIESTTSAHGFRSLWEAVVHDFVARRNMSAIEYRQSRVSWFEAGARQRIATLVDPGSFVELMIARAERRE